MAALQKSGSPKLKSRNTNPSLTQELPAPATETNQEHSLESHELSTQQQLHEKAEFLNKIQTLQYILETDLLACDAKWTLFVAAALSYRYDSVLKPFPSQFVCEQKGYDIDKLIIVIYDTPKLRVLLQSLMEQNYNDLTREVIDLLYWVLVELREPALRLIEGEELYSIITSIDEKCAKLKPTHAFEIKALTGPHSEVAFRSRTKQLPLKQAFMGIKLDSLYSLLQNGYTQTWEAKNPITLTTDLKTSLHHSPNCAAWGASQCGSIIACTAICEFALDTDKDQIVENKNDKSCVDIQLHNLENIRIRYLLFYGRRFPRKLMPKKYLWSWIYKHKYSLSLLSYMLFLMSIGFVNSGSGDNLKFYVSRKIDLLMDFWRRIITREPVQ